jgi:hypothetical protein
MPPSPLATGRLHRHADAPPRAKILAVPVSHRIYRRSWEARRASLQVFQGRWTDPETADLTAPMTPSKQHRGASSAICQKPRRCDPSNPGPDLSAATFAMFPILPENVAIEESGCAIHLPRSACYVSGQAKPRRAIPRRTNGKTGISEAPGAEARGASSVLVCPVPRESAHRAGTV